MVSDWALTFYRNKVKGELSFESVKVFQSDKQKPDLIWHWPNSFSLTGVLITTAAFQPLLQFQLRSLLGVDEEPSTPICRGKIILGSQPSSLILQPSQPGSALIKGAALFGLMKIRERWKNNGPSSCCRRTTAWQSRTEAARDRKNPPTYILLCYFIPFHWQSVTRFCV